MENLIEVRGLCKNYPDFSLNQVDLTLPRGAIVGLVGENGAGKTTTLKAILNVIRPDGGTIRLLGHSAGEAVAREKVGVVFEDGFFQPSLNARQIGKIMSHLCKGWQQQKYESLCRRFQLPETKSLKEFSRGMKMKLSLATALGRDPQVLVLDEATSGLDPVVRGEMLDLFLEFIQDENKGILISSHITSDLERVADQIAYIHKGKLIFQKNKDQLMEEMAVLHCSENQLDQLPKEWIIARSRGSFGSAALVNHPDRIHEMLPEAVMEKAGIDDMMRFYAGRKEK